jgi:hypothetical protein
LAIRVSGDDGSTCLLASARNASMMPAVSAGRVTMNRCPSSIIRNFPQHRGARRHHGETGRGRGEHQPPAQLWILMRELLRDSTAPGDAGDVNLCVAELRNKAGGQPRQC